MNAVLQLQAGLKAACPQTAAYIIHVASLRWLCLRSACQLPEAHRPGACIYQISYAAGVRRSGICLPNACPSFEAWLVLGQHGVCAGAYSQVHLNCLPVLACASLMAKQKCMAGPTISNAVQSPVPKQPAQPQSLHCPYWQCWLSGPPIRCSSDDQPGCIGTGGYSVDVQTEGAGSSEPAHEWDQLQQGCSRCAGVMARGGPAP